MAHRQQPGAAAARLTRRDHRTPSTRRAVEDFHFGARVVSADGRHIGSLNSMIVDGESFDVHAIVVKETHGFSGHHVAARPDGGRHRDPGRAVRDVEREQITLAITSAEARRTEPYLTYHYAPSSAGTPAGC